MRGPRHAAALLLLVSAGGTACSDDSAPRPAVPADSAAPTRASEAPVEPNPAGSAPADTGWTAGIVDRPPGDPGQATLRSVTAARHEEYDRVVWELSKLPGVHLEYVDEPVRDCGAGRPIPLPGQGWLEVRLEPARAHTEAGRPTVPSRRIEADLPAVLELVRTCDFEGIVSWVLAVRSPEPFRLLRLDDPPRIVVDVRHRSR